MARLKLTATVRVSNRVVAKFAGREGCVVQAAINTPSSQGGTYTRHNQFLDTGGPYAAACDLSGKPVQMPVGEAL